MVTRDERDERSRRSRAASTAALTRWAFEDTRAGTEKARAAFNDRFEREVDPDQQLDPAERARRAARLRRAYFQRLAAKSVASRRAKKEHR